MNKLALLVIGALVVVAFFGFAFYTVLFSVIDKYKMGSIRDTILSERAEEVDGFVGKYRYSEYNENQNRGANQAY